MKRLLCAATTAAATIPAVHGQITVFDVNPDISITPGSIIMMDLETGTAITSFFPERNAFFYFGGSENLRFGVTGDWRIALSSGSYAARYTLGYSLSFSNLSAADSPLALDGTSNNGGWSGDTGSAISYLAIKNVSDLREGWLGIKFDDVANSLTLASFAVAPASVGIAAGQTVVPEPGETAAVMALLAGSAALWHRRRKQKQALPAAI